MHPVRRRFLGLSMAALILLSAPPPAFSAAPGGLAVEDASIVRIGFDGQTKVGKWTPVSVSVAVSAPCRLRLVVEAPDPDGNPVTFPAPVSTIDSAGQHRLRGCFKLGRLDGRVRVWIEAEDETGFRRVPVSPAGQEGRALGLLAAEDLVSHRQSVVLAATLGRPAGFAVPADGVEGARVAELAAAEQLPESAVGYDALDVIVVAGSYAIDPERSEALRDWVRGGGHLVLSVGENVHEYLDSPLAEWVPVPLVTGREPLRLRELTALETYAEKASPIAVPRATGVPAARIGPVDGEVVLSGRDGPLLVRAAEGFGTVTFLGVDLDRPPLSTWPSVADAARRMAFGDQDRVLAQRAGQPGQLTSLGISDLATQLHAAQEHFPQVGRFPLWMVMGLLFLYLLVVGPLDYLIVHRLLGRPRLTWITFPLMVSLGAFLAAWGARVANGTEVFVNQIDLLDIDATSRSARLQSWMTLYSPRTTRYEVSATANGIPWKGHRSAVDRTAETAASLRTVLHQAEPGGGREAEPRDARPQPIVAWSGVPESAVGGLYRTGGLDLGRNEYVFTPGAAGVSNLPVPIWSTRGLNAVWRAETDPLVESRLESPGWGQLAGSLVHDLPFPLEDWILAYGNRVYGPGVRASEADAPAQWQPGETWPRDGFSAEQPRELSSFLTRTALRRVERARGAGGEDLRFEQTPYPIRSRDPEEIVRMITFHRVVGGKAYTGLDNHMLRDLDLSGLLSLNRAVLFARIPEPAAQLHLGDGDGDARAVEPARHAAFVRIVLPVKPSDSPRPSTIIRDVIRD